MRIGNRTESLALEIKNLSTNGWLTKPNELEFIFKEIKKRAEEILQIASTPAPTYEEIEACLKTHLPFYECEDKDDFLYIVREDQLKQAAARICYLIGPASREEGAQAPDLELAKEILVDYGRDDPNSELFRQRSIFVANRIKQYARLCIADFIKRNELIPGCELEAVAPSGTGDAPGKYICPKCGGHLVGTSHGLYCPKPTCKWGWEIELDGSSLQPPTEATRASLRSQEKK